MSQPQSLARRSNTQRVERSLALIAIITIVVAWFVGAAQAEADVVPLLSQALPSATRFQPASNGTYAAYDNDQLIGYVTIGTANGYGGPMKVAVAADLTGKVVGLAIVSQKETPLYLQRVLSSKLVPSIAGKTYNDPLNLGQDINGVTGATYTSRAIIDAVRAGSREIAANQLGLNVPPESAPSIKFGIPEIILIALFFVGFIGHQSKFKYKKAARWGSMLAGLIVLGFIYNLPLTMANVSSLLLGFWPQWQTNLYWFLLIGGILFVFTIDNKNPYCEWFCPFGAAQECMGVIGGAKTRTPQRYRELLHWTQRGLAWFAIVVALLYRSPGPSSYEVFGTLFSFTGSSIQFLLLAIVLVAALFIKRPWCNYLCPLRPVTDFIRLIRNWVHELWQRLRPKPAQAKSSS